MLVNEYKIRNKAGGSRHKGKKTEMVSTRGLVSGVVEWLGHRTCDRIGMKCGRIALQGNTQ